MGEDKKNDDLRVETPDAQPSEEVMRVYTEPAEYSFARYHSTRAGLSSEEVARRQKALGGKRNELTEEEEKSLVLQFLEKFTDPMVVMLLVSACISLLMKQYDDAFSIILAVVIVSTVGFVQEYKSEQSVEALKELIAHRCVAIRDGKPEDVLAADLVAGDVVQLAAGVRVPADMRLFETTNLAVNESLLTGEVEPASKQSGVVDAATGTHLAERSNMAFMGTSVAAGSGLGVVTAIGDDTELGTVAKMLQDTEKKTPLQYSMDQLAKQLSLFSTVAIAVICLIGFAQGKPALQMFNMAVSLIVAAIPEGLPIAVTVTLALGVNRMAARNAIVRKLPAVEALGATNVICVDKTGTLTQNQMTVAELYTTQPIVCMHAADSLVDGGVVLCAEATGEVIADPLKDRDIAELLRAAVLCNNADISTGALIGQPTEGGLLSLAHKLGCPDYRKSTRRLEEIPFDSETKWMAVKVEAEPQPKYYVKGAAEVIAARCVDGFGAPVQREAILAAYRNMAAKALRVIALACSTNAPNASGEEGEGEGDMLFLGLVGLRDPPRAGVREAVAECRRNHVRVVMITGDSRETALAVARELELCADVDAPGVALSAAELDALPADDPAAQERIKGASVFYRMTPAHKVKVVNAHSARGGSIVAMTGDGVNDAPALSRADIGIAMGRGSDVCKEASEIILVDNNFSTIVAAIDEGKVIFENIKNFLHFQLTTSVAAMLLIACCSILDLPLPLNATQILLINIIMDGPPAQSLTFEKYRDRQHSTPPRDPKASIVSRAMAVKIALSSILMVIGTVGIFLFSLPSQDRDIHVLNAMNDSPAMASTMAFTTFVLFQVFNAVNCRSFTKSVFTVGVFSNSAFNYSTLGTLVAQLLVIYVRPLQLIFRTSALTLPQLGLCVAVASSVWVIDEVIKLFSRRN